MIKKHLAKLVEKNNLSLEETKEIFEQVMEGEISSAQIASFLVALRMKGETVEEITGAAQTMLAKSVSINPKVENLIDTCGTGGDGSGTFNISTAVAILVASCGVAVAKHGNRAVSSKCGSADVLEALGIVVDLPPHLVEKCIEQIGIGFLFAPNFHPAMKNAAGPRKELGLRTIFNLLGPLTNPASPEGQVLGVYHPDLTEVAAKVLGNLGRKRAMVVHGYPGMDEFSLAGETRVSILDQGEVNTITLLPEDVGLKRWDLQEIQGGAKEENAKTIKEIFKGREGAVRDITLFNAGAALVVGGVVQDIKEGIFQAQRALDNGAAARKLEEWAAYSQELARGVRECS